MSDSESASDYYSDSTEHQVESQDSDDAMEEKLNALKQELSEVSFEQLAEIQRTMGKKEFNKQFSKSETKKEAVPSIKKREHKHKQVPMEVTSKRPVSRNRQVVEVKKKAIRDPRFDRTSGIFNPDLFQRSYGFIKEMEHNELKEIQDKIEKTKDEQEKSRLEKLAQKMSTKFQEEKKEERRQKLKSEWKKSERELVKKGKTPYFMKKSDMKKMELVEKFKEMKGKNIDRFLEKKRKRNAAKEKRHMPYNRRSE